MGMIATTYGYVYVAQIALGANPAQTIKAIKEAEAYPGPSLVIAYAPCINHGIKSKGNMANSIAEEKKAVETGYWHLWRFNPELKEEGKNPFVLTRKSPRAPFVNSWRVKTDTSCSSRHILMLQRNSSQKLKKTCWKDTKPTRKWLNKQTHGKPRVNYAGLFVFLLHGKHHSVIGKLLFPLSRE